MKMGAKVVWKEGLNFDGINSTGVRLPLGANAAHGGTDDTVSPMELLLLGLAGCTGMDVISILEKRKVNVAEFEVHVSGERAEEHPKYYTNITVEYIVKGKGIAEKDVQRAVDLSSEKYCSVQYMLKQSAKIENKITILETVDA
jgi:putative redox protein